MPHKILSTFFVSIITLLGFASLGAIIGLNQPEIFFKTAVYIYAFHILWIVFVYDLHLKHRASVELTSAKLRDLIRRALIVRFKHFLHWPYLRHYLNYLILPTLVFWSVAMLLYMNPFFMGLKNAIIFAATGTLAVYYWHMKEHLAARFEQRSWSLKVFGAVKLIAAYLVFAAVFGAATYYGLDRNLLFYFVLTTSFLLIYQALFQHDFTGPKMTLIILAVSVLIGITGVWIVLIWNAQYFTAALVLLAIYNTLWAFVHHTLDKTFTSQLALEYLVLAMLIVSIIFATHNFGTRVI